MCVERRVAYHSSIFSIVTDFPNCVKIKQGKKRENTSCKVPTQKKKPPLFNPKPFFPNPKLWRRTQSCRAAATAKDSFNPHVGWTLDSTTSYDFFHNNRVSKEGDKEGASVLATLLSCFRAGAGRMLM
jgi:hypothetical protein